MSSPSSTADTGKLIRLVRSNPVLYDVNHPQYKDNEVKNDIWLRICNELAFDSIDVARTKWRNLRDSFVKCLKCNRYKGSALKKYSRWPWAGKMEFLKPFLPSKFVKCETIATSLTDQEESNCQYQDFGEDPQNFIGDADEDQQAVDGFGGKRHKLIHSSEELIARRSSNLEAIDHLFLSYAQTMKTFSRKRQVMIKSQLSNLMSQAELEEIDEQEDPLASLQHHLHYEHNDGTNGYAKA